MSADDSRITVAPIRVAIKQLAAIARTLRMENKPPDDEGWGGGEILARYERGVMLFLLILTVTLLALGAYLIGV